MIDFEQDAAVLPSEANLKRLSATAQELVDLKLAAGLLEDNIATNKARQRELEERVLPDLMSELQLSDFRLASGARVEVVEVVAGSIKKEKRAEAHRWLVEHGFGDLVKAVVEVKFDRGEVEAALALAEQIMTNYNHRATVEESVHPQTLGAWAREQLGRPAEERPQLPLDLLGIFVGRRAKVTL